MTPNTPTPGAEIPISSKQLKISYLKESDLKEWAQSKLVIKDKLPKCMYPSVYGDFKMTKESNDYVYGPVQVEVTADNSHIRKSDMKSYFPSLVNKIDFEPERRISDYNGNRIDSLCKTSKLLLKNLPLFEIDSISIQGDSYVFTSTDEKVYSVGIQDFVENGLMAESLGLSDNSITLKTSTFQIKRQDNGFQICHNRGSPIDRFVGTAYFLDEKSGILLAAQEGGTLNRYKIDEKGKVELEQEGIKYPRKYALQEITQIRQDNNGNFLIVALRDNSGSEYIDILNKKTLQFITSIKNFSQISAIGNDYFDALMYNNNGTEASRFRVNINFGDFGEGFTESGTVIPPEEIEFIDPVKTAALEALERGIDITPRVKQVDTTDAKLQEAIWNTKVGDTTLKELFDSASTGEEIEKVLHFLQQVSSHPDINRPGINSIIKEIQDVVNAKRNNIQVEDLRIQFKNIEIQTQEALDLGETSGGYFPSLLEIEKRVVSLEKSRSQMSFLDTDFDRQIGELRDRVKASIQSYKIKNESLIIQKIDDNIQKIKDKLETIQHNAQITQIYNDASYKETEEMIALLNDDTKKDQYRNTLGDLVSERIQAIQDELSREKERGERETKQRIATIEKEIKNIVTILSGIKEISGVDEIEKTDPLVQKLKTYISTLETNEANRLTLLLESTFQEAKRKIRLEKNQQKGLVHTLDESGIDTSLYFSETVKSDIDFKLVGNRTASGSIRLELMYDDGTVFNMDTYLQNPQKLADGIIFHDIPGEMSQADFIKFQRNLSEFKAKGEKEIQEIRQKLIKDLYANGEEKEYLQERMASLRKKYRDSIAFIYFASYLASKLNLNPRSHLELPDPRFIVLDEEKATLEQISIGFSIQKNQGKGIEILEGAPGLGKTEICRFFSASTNREIVSIQCSKMDPSDLFFSPQLKAGETSRQPAEWIKLMQKPGTVILFDEIDKLSSQCFERLHSLFDGRRSIFDPQLGWVKAHPDCLLIGTRNSYEKMSNPIVSRSTITQVKAPSESNEAFKISKYTGIDYFEFMDMETFQECWNLPIPKDIEVEDSKGTHQVVSVDLSKGIPNKLPIEAKLDFPKLLLTMKNIHGLVKVFRILREKQNSKDFDQKYEYEVSYRDAETIFRTFSQKRDTSFKQVARDILVAKSRAIVLDRDDKDTQEQIVSTIIDENL